MTKRKSPGLRGSPGILLAQRSRKERQCQSSRSRSGANGQGPPGARRAVSWSVSTREAGRFTSKRSAWHPMRGFPVASIRTRKSPSSCRKETGRDPRTRAAADRSGRYRAGPGRERARLSESVPRAGAPAVCVPDASSRASRSQHPGRDVGVPVREGVIWLPITPGSAARRGTLRPGRCPRERVCARGF